MISHHVTNTFYVTYMDRLVSISYTFFKMNLKIDKCLFLQELLNRFYAPKKKINSAPICHCNGMGYLLYNSFLSFNNYWADSEIAVCFCSLK